MKNMEIRNHITLTGPASVGKSFIASELSKKTGLPVVSIDEIIMMIREEQNGELSFKDETTLKKFKMKYLMYAGYNDLPDTLKPVLEQQIDDYIQKYKFYSQVVDGLENLYQIIDEYDAVCAEIKKPSTEFAVAFSQRLHLKILDKFLKSVNKPVIFDTPAPTGFDPKFKNDDGKTIDYIECEGFMIPVKELQNKFSEIMSLSGTIVFLKPGADYAQRCGANDEFNQLLIKHLDNYQTKAKTTIVVDGLFNNPNEKTLKTRQRFDVSTQEKISTLTNNNLIDEICKTIIEESSKEPNGMGE